VESHVFASGRLLPNFVAISRSRRLVISAGRGSAPLHIFAESVSRSARVVCPTCSLSACSVLSARPYEHDLGLIQVGVRMNAGGQVKMTSRSNESVEEKELAFSDAFSVRLALATTFTTPRPPRNGLGNLGVGSQAARRFDFPVPSSGVHESPGLGPLSSVSTVCWPGGRLWFDGWSWMVIIFGIHSPRVKVAGFICRSWSPARPRWLEPAVQKAGTFSASLPVVHWSRHDRLIAFWNCPPSTTVTLPGRHGRAHPPTTMFAVGCATSRA